MKKVKQLPKQERSREKLMNKGAQALSDRELLAVILGKGVAGHNVFQLSKNILKIFDSQIDKNSLAKQLK